LSTNCKLGENWGFGVKSANAREREFVADCLDCREDTRGFLGVKGNLKWDLTNVDVKSVLARDACKHHAAVDMAGAHGTFNLLYVEDGGVAGVMVVKRLKSGGLNREFAAAVDWV
jgi:hypothetical protein